MVQKNNDDYGENHFTRPHECDEVQTEGQIELACGCVLPAATVTLCSNDENKLKQWKLQMIPCSEGEVNGIKTKVLRDTTGSTTCIVKTALVRPEQMTGSYGLCMLIDGVIKRYRTTVVELKTLYYTGTVKALCMENPVQDMIIGNVSGVLGAETQINTEHNVNTDIDANTLQTHSSMLSNMTEQTITKANDDITMNDDQTIEMDGQTEEADDFTIDTSQVST